MIAVAMEALSDSAFPAFDLPKEGIEILELIRGISSGEIPRDSFPITMMP
jgi:hypothetical protein